jgi:hypothetical protein
MCPLPLSYMVLMFGLQLLTVWVLVMLCWSHSPLLRWAIWGILRIHQRKTFEPQIRSIPWSATKRCFQPERPEISRKILGLSVRSVMNQAVDNVLWTYFRISSWVEHSKCKEPERSSRRNATHAHCQLEGRNFSSWNWCNSDFKHVSYIYIYIYIYIKLNSVAWVREGTIPTERPPLASKVSGQLLRIEGCRVVRAADPLGP